MKQLYNESNQSSNDQLADLILDSAFKIVHGFRNEIRQQQPGGLSLSAYRVLAFIGRRQVASLTQVADHLGVMLPTTSKLVQDLVASGYLMRDYDPNNRRLLQITVSEAGHNILSSGRRDALDWLASALLSLSNDKQKLISDAIELLSDTIPQCTNTHTLCSDRAISALKNE